MYYLLLGPTVNNNDKQRNKTLQLHLVHRSLLCYFNQLLLPLTMLLVSIFLDLSDHLFLFGFNNKQTGQHQTGNILADWVDLLGVIIITFSSLYCLFYICSTNESEEN